MLKVIKHKQTKDPLQANSNVRAKIPNRWNKLNEGLKAAGGGDNDPAS